jgi:hypothetical protein
MDNLWKLQFVSGEGAGKKIQPYQTLSFPIRSGMTEFMFFTL